MDVAYNLDVANGYVYAACYILGGVHAIDIADPENPSINGYYYRSGLFALNVTANNHDIYIADGSSGFQIYNHEVIFTDLEEIIETADQLNIYPNPSNGIINLDVENATEVVVFDKSGRLLRKEKINDGTNILDLSTLAVGIYFVKIKMKDRIQIQKIVIAR